MTPLRQQLGSLKRAYDATGYGGDLAAELLGAAGPMTMRGVARRWPARLAGAAIAAAAVVAFGLYHPAALEGVAALPGSLDSIKHAAQDTGLWPAGSSAASAGGGAAEPFGIVPAFRLPLPDPPRPAPADASDTSAATQESA